MLRHTLNTKNGLLSPAGKLYPCEYAGHDDLAYTLRESLGLSRLEPWGAQDHLLEELGWMKLQTSDCNDDCESFWCAPTPGNWNPPTWDHITQKQRDTVFDWCQKHNVELPAQMRPSHAVAA